MPMPTISVSQEVYNELKKHSESWEDTPNKIIAGLLKIEEKVSLKAPTKFRYNPRDITIPSSIVKKLIIFVLGEHAPGVVPVQMVESEITKLMECNNLLSVRDLERGPSGRGRRHIEYKIDRCRAELMELELVGRSGDSFKLTEEGLKEYEEVKADSRLLKRKEESPQDLAIPQATYKYTRLCFIRSKIDPLNPDDSFRIICNDGIFQMTQHEFYEVFDNVITTRSYIEKGLYHSPSPPRKARQFKIL